MFLLLMEFKSNIQQLPRPTHGIYIYIIATAWLALHTKTKKINFCRVFLWQQCLHAFWKTFLLICMLATVCVLVFPSWRSELVQPKSLWHVFIWHIVYLSLSKYMKDTPAAGCCLQLLWASKVIYKHGRSCAQFILSLKTWKHAEKHAFSTCFCPNYVLAAVCKHLKSAVLQVVMRTMRKKEVPVCKWGALTWYSNNSRNITDACYVVITLIVSGKF